MECTVKQNFAASKSEFMLRCNILYNHYRIPSMNITVFLCQAHKTKCHKAAVKLVQHYLRLQCKNTNSTTMSRLPKHLINYLSSQTILQYEWTFKTVYLQSFFIQWIKNVWQWMFKQSKHEGETIFRNHTTTKFICMGATAENSKYWKTEVKGPLQSPVEACRGVKSPWKWKKI